MGGILGAVERLARAARADGWENVLLGMGGTKDPSVYTTFGSRAHLAEMLLEALYVEDHFARKIVEALPRHAMRPGWELTSGGDPSSSAALRESYRLEEERLGLAEELSQGAVWGRLFGGAVTWIGANDGRGASTPLDEEAIRSIDFLHTFDRRDVTIETVYDDPRNPRFQKPKTYRIRPQITAGTRQGGAAVGHGLIVHESRTLRWGGQPTTDSRRAQLQGWDDSVLESAWDALRQVAEDYGAKSLLLGRISQAVYKIRELYSMIAGGQKEILETRMGLLDQSRSRARAILLDTDEDLVNVTQPISGVDALMDKGLIRLGAAATMPVAILLGQPISSFEGTNDGDLEVWTQELEEWRKSKLTPNHTRVASLLLAAAEGPAEGNPPDEWSISYGPLRVPTPKEGAEIRKLEAETDAIRIDKGMATAEAIAVERFSPRPGADLVLDAEELAANLTRRKELAKQPPKDNAELGTVAPRSADIREIQGAYNREELSRAQAVSALVLVHRYTEPDAERLLGPEADRPNVEPAPASPGPDPEPQQGQGAGAPAGLPGFNAGGDPAEGEG